MLKKILILTFRNPFNYGAELQSFALQYFLRLHFQHNNEQADIKVLNIARPTFDLDAKCSRQKIYHVSKKKILRAYIALYKNHFLNLFKHNSIRKQKIRLSKDFHKKYNHLTKRVRSFDELYKKDLGYTHYIVGSDQVWNYEYRFSLEPYFLTFAKTSKKIAYAASIGFDHLPERLKKYYKDRISKFDFVSSREIQGANILQDLLNKPVQTLLDPTLLITPEQYRECFQIDKKSNGSIVIYLRRHNKYNLDLAKYLAKKNNIKKIILISAECHHDIKDKEIEVRYNVSAPEFVDLVSNAEIVITNSFHGTAFSVNFAKDLYCVVSSQNQTSSRFYSLLEQTNLLDRIIAQGTVFDQIEVKPINSFQVREKLDNLRKTAIDFLDKALE